MIKATISNNTQRNAFAKAGAHKIAGGKCVSKSTVRGIVLNKYKFIASGTCHLIDTPNKDNVIFLSNKNQKEVA